MNSSTKSIIEYFTSSPDREEPVIELYRASIDLYTFMLHLKYYLQDKRNLAVEIKDIGASPNISWKVLAAYFANRYRSSPYFFEFTKVLMSYYQSSFVGDIKSNKMYKFIRTTGTNGSQFYIVLNKKGNRYAYN